MLFFIHSLYLIALILIVLSIIGAVRLFSRPLFDPGGQLLGVIINMIVGCMFGIFAKLLEMVF